MLKLSCFTYNYFSNKTQVMCIIILALKFFTRKYFILLTIFNTYFEVSRLKKRFKK